MELTLRRGPRDLPQRVLARLERENHRGNENPDIKAKKSDFVFFSPAEDVHSKITARFVNAVF